MKTVLVPMFAVVHVDDGVDAEDAHSFVEDALALANRQLRLVQRDAYILMDEELPNVEVPYDRNAEYHTMLQETGVTPSPYKVGDKVWWTDPDAGECSGLYIVAKVDDVYTLENDAGSEVEALASELASAKEVV